MIIDTSSILAILQNEPERREFNEIIEAASAVQLGEPLLYKGSAFSMTDVGVAR